MIQQLAILIVIASAVTGCTSTLQPKSNAPAGYHLVWADEFDKPGLPDTNKWNYDIGGHGWGNNELQYYTDRNAHVANGLLVIEAQKEELNNMHYTSARMVSKSKGDWLYGRIDVRAKVPKGRGTWPAVWMLPTDWAYGGWPKSGEIDIMEHVGFDTASIHGSVHTEAYNHIKHTQKTAIVQVPDAETTFHVYSMGWTADTIHFFIDDKRYLSFGNEHKDFAEWPFDKRFHVLLNVAVGGFWGAMHGVDDSIWPQQMLVDYVRVYQK